ncbi:hypothetical protein A2Z33_00995 [Candidatus Gottesmanbacteria bacterium RBG_16_52_11]|uniref:Calcium-binding protein n=1 Tax=Candidatus Gottesmanbacteria bacterium RBG_16_52_11 TaxID=1798374 RepID=A0A1F5YNN4_9BACT|nr:MAG: hypothetical protein A2Z33_00995 [Candidatus Gottesmanbacteria bacterium RBG_16_52_11]
MKHITLKNIIIIASVVILAGFAGYFRARQPYRGIVQAVGDLNIIWGVPDGSPIFVVQNMLPGDTESRTVTVENTGLSAHALKVRGIQRSVPDSFPTVLDFSLAENGTDVYGGTSPTGAKTLQDFFNDTATPSSIPLSVFAPGNSKNYTFRIHFQESAGNEYQLARVIFDIVFGIESDIPAQCAHMTFSGEPIYGTAHEDTLYGTSGNDLIYAYENEDEVYGQEGDDCIVGGSGNDKLDGGSGDDVVIGDSGDDQMYGGTGSDRMYGDSGHDTIESGDGDDLIDGSSGNDKITSGSGIDNISGGTGDDIIDSGDGNDTIESGEGRDTVYAGSGDDTVSSGDGSDKVYLGTGKDTADTFAGNDEVYGEDGNDTMTSTSGNDQLTGGNGTDYANAGSGTDTCNAETEISCEL